jgi:putative tricarboxylic transport membrane protein
MSGDGNTASHGPAHRTVELALAGAIGLFGALVVYGALKAGIGWSFEGPQAGFFPFYIGLCLIGATAVNIWQVMSGITPAKIFAEWDQLRQVASVAIPTAVYIVLIAYIGIYVSSVLLIAYFMMRISSYGWLRTVIVAISVPLLTFIVFERWFLVALPKGPLEAMLGF